MCVKTRKIKPLQSRDCNKTTAGAKLLPTAQRGSGVIEFDEVSCGYGGGPLLADVSLRLAPGSFYFLTGPSGAGKTTLLKLCYGELIATSGRVGLFGQDARSLDRDDIAMVRRRVGVVHQDCQFLDHLTVTENIGLPMEEVAKSLGVRVSYDPMHGPSKGGGGLCRVRGEYRVIDGHGQEIAKEIREISVNLNERLTKNKEAIDRIVVNVDASMASLRSITANLDERITVNEENIDDTMSRMRSAAVNLDQFTYDLKMNPWKLLYRPKDKRERSIQMLKEERGGQ